LKCNCIPSRFLTELNSNRKRTSHSSSSWPSE